MEPNATNGPEFTDDTLIAERPASSTESKTKKRRLPPELLALGEQMIYSAKRRRDIEDAGWNRHTNNDEGLPDWFVEDEKKHCRKELPVTKEQVAIYKKRQREMNARPIKKVAEAKARKRQRASARMEKAKSRAQSVVDNPDLEHGEKMREMKKIYGRAASSSQPKKKVHYEVMTKGKRGGTVRPTGNYKVVDRRMKKDLRKENKSNKGKNKSKKKERR